MKPSTPYTSLPYNSQPSDASTSVEQSSLPGAHSTEEGSGRHSLEPRAVSCQECQRLQWELDTALRALNDRSCARYGDLLREKFSLKIQVQFGSSNSRSPSQQSFSCVL